MSDEMKRAEDKVEDKMEGPAGDYRRLTRAFCGQGGWQKSWWRRRESNPRPKSMSVERLHA